MLGANIGTALVTWALSFDITILFSGLLLAGVVTFRSSARSRSRNIGRAMIGLGLMLLALHLLVETIHPDAVGPQGRQLIAVLTREPLIVLLLTAGLAWAMHTSIAPVLVTASLTAAGLVTPVASLAMVLGANLGTAVTPLVNALSGERTALRLPLGNLLTRTVGLAVALPFLPEIVSAITGQVPGPGRLPILFHLLFNTVLALAFLPSLTGFGRLLERLLPARPNPADPSTPRYLDPASLSEAPVALANAARETLRMADVVEAMLQGSRQLLAQDDRRLVTDLRRMDDVLDRLHAALKAYLAELAPAGLDAAERTRLHWILATALNLEHAGDILDKGLLDLADKRIRRRLAFTPQELDDTRAMHDHLLAQLRLAVAVFMGEDVQAALRLVEEKERFREFERAATEGQLARLEAGSPGSETGALHLDVVRDLKRVESHLAAIAHPLLDRSNLLRSSRLLRLPRPSEGARS
jgi:phosphate:Na+ symporter